MKKSANLLIILCLLLGHKALSQNYIIKGGLNLATAFHKNNDSKLSSDYRLNPGFHVGVIMENPLNDHIFIDFGLLLSQKGFSNDYESENVPGSLEYVSNPLYLDFPVQIKFFKPLKNDFRILGAIGPYFGIGFSGTNKIKLNYAGNSNTTDTGIRWGGRDMDSDYSNPDYGLTFGAGIEKKSFVLMAGYDLGIANISSFTQNDTVFQNRVIKISFGYKLGS